MRTSIGRVGDSLRWLTDRHSIAAGAVRHSVTQNRSTPMTNEQTDADFLRELAHYTSTLSIEAEATVFITARGGNSCEM